ncbi:uncharacterized protein LOC130669098 isoform X2 [Microplitis mediator]|uniref:uncharacterized protein LOC130669098 isoform X2 n=1 Tax=Microplitis mediator TaxID=375433 RepID=UPI0025523448|nr:uncharacterized protein LOC130669098 isoform X2 [Microplitis mediator]
MWIKNIILSFFFVSVSCNKILYRDISALQNDLVVFKHTSQLLDLCFSNVTNPIVMSENVVDAFRVTAPELLKRPIMIINNNFEAKDVQLYLPSHPTYVLSVRTIAELEELLNKLRRSPSWNIASTFFLVLKTKKCNISAFLLLSKLWSFNLLSSFVVCHEVGHGTSLYTFNPFTKRAPDRWIKVKLIDMQIPRFTVYKRPFVNDLTIFDNLNFDKTKFLDLYPIKVAASNKYRDFIEQDVFPHLNVSVIKTMFRQTENSDPVFDSLIYGKKDISHSQYDVNDLPNEYVDAIPVTYDLSLVIVTQKRTFISRVREIVSIFDLHSGIAIIIILLIITIMIILTNGYQIRLAFLDVLRLLLSMGMDSPLDRFAMKILFFTAFLFVFTFGPALQGQLSAILTRPPSYNVETLKDLYDHKYHLHYDLSLHRQIINEELWTTVEDMSFLHPGFEVLPDDCLKLATQDNTVACIYLEHLTIKRALNEKNLYISKTFSFKTNFVYVTRRDWPLKDRIHKNLLNAIESGFRQKTFRSLIKNPLKKKKKVDRIKKILKYDEVDAIDLEYFYIFFAFIQLLAVLIFGIEFLVAQFRRRRR